MMKFAWDGYRKYAWGYDELKPASKSGYSALGFGCGTNGRKHLVALSIDISGVHGS